MMMCARSERPSWGAIQALGVQSEGQLVLANYQSFQDPTGLVRMATFVNGLRSVVVYYSEGPEGFNRVQVAEQIMMSRP